MINELKKLTPVDWEAFRDFRLESLRSDDAKAFGGSYEKESVRSEEEWKKRLDGSRDSFFYGYFDGGKIISSAGAYLNIEKNEFYKKWIIVGVYTNPDFRGQGFSTKTISAVIEELKSKNIKEVMLMVNVDQKAAVHVYKKLGFKILKTLKNVVMGNGYARDEFVMEKVL